MAGVVRNLEEYTVRPYQVFEANVGRAKAA